jgi:hypothetical protein
MHTSSELSKNQKIISIFPAACLSLLTLVSLSISGRPENYPMTLAIFTVFITLIFIVALIRARP